MEARSAFRGTGISKLFVAAVLVVVAFGLGVMGAYVAKNLSAPAAAHSHTILSPAYQQIDTRGVTQVGSQSFLGPDAQERNRQLAALAAPLAKGHGALP